MPGLQSCMLQAEGRVDAVFGKVGLLFGLHAKFQIGKFLHQRLNQQWTAMHEGGAQARAEAATHSLVSRFQSVCVRARGQASSTLQR